LECQNEGEIFVNEQTNVSNLMGLAGTALLGGNNSEALRYFNRVLEVDPKLSQAWIGKAKAAGWQSTLANIRIPETLIAFNHAIATSSDEQKTTTTEEAVEETNRLVVAIYGLARDQLEEYVALNDTWNQYTNQIAQLIDALTEVKKWSPFHRTTLENIVHLCKDNIEGVSYRDPYDNNAPKAWHLSPQYEAFLKSELDAAVEALKAIDSSYSAPTVEKKAAEACFVVTTTMGDANHPTVIEMRKFRDEWLMRRSWGVKFIRQYYRVGPVAARFIAKRNIYRYFSYRSIVLPAVFITRILTRRR
jgi:hypothetical protein